MTVVVTPRERWSRVLPTVEHLLEHTQPGYRLVFMDGRSPRVLRRAVERRLAGTGARVIRGRRHVTPNEARVRALQEIETELVVFLDNDVEVAPGWLDALVGCIDETGAPFVSPHISLRDDFGLRGHAAAGIVRVEVRGGRRTLRDDDVHRDIHPFDVRARLSRGPVSSAELHCVLVRTDVARVVGFDADYSAAMEHLDFSLRVTERYGDGQFEPTAQVTYVAPPPSTPTDLPYFLLRWNRRWVAASVERFRRAWGLEPDDPVLEAHRSYLDEHRWRPVRRALWSLRSRAGARVTRAALAAADVVIEAVLVRPAERARRVVSVRRSGSASEGRPGA